MTMPANDLITHYGLLAVFAGSGIEGEPFAIAGGILAHRRLLPLWQVAAAATIGSYAVDQLWFFLGRHFRTHKSVVGISKRPAFAEAIDLIERRPTIFILCFRFAYGLRAIAPVAIGTARVSAARFMILNLLAAVIWGPLFTGIGYVFGTTFEHYFPKSTSTILFIALAILLVSIIGTRIALRRR